LGVTYINRQHGISQVQDRRKQAKERITSGYETLTVDELIEKLHGLSEDEKIRVQGVIFDDGKNKGDVT
jgi:hypothetical protein